MLFKADIEGLIALGAPDDEYDDEAILIADFINKINTQNRDFEVIREGVLKIWQQSFDLSDDDLRLRYQNIDDVVRMVVQNVQ